MFCEKCGASIKDGRDFCTNCGQSVHSSTTPEMYTLTIKREKQRYAVNPTVQVKIDDNLTYLLEKEGVLEITISGGNHHLKFSCSVRNKSININLLQNTSLNVGFNRITGELEVTPETDGKTEAFVNTPVQKAPYNLMCIIGFVISIISYFINFWGIVGMAGIIVSIIGLSQIQRNHENGKGLAIVGIIIGAISVLYAFVVLSNFLI